jgi:outer membrane protein
MMKKYIILSIICLTSFFASAQSTIIRINYLPAVSLGNTADFTNNFSLRGSEIVVDKFLTEDLSVGFSVGWNVFREKVIGESFEYKNSLITGTQFRYTNIVPLNVKANKYFGNNTMKPFIGVGIGTAYAKQTNNAGIFSFVDDAWQFNLTPEAGIQSKVSRELLVSFKIKYSYGFEAKEFPAMSYLGFGLGIGLL